MRVGWLFSMARSGSSAADYGAAAPWGHAVADEIFGPWDRTDPPYDYPEAQLDLVAAMRVSRGLIDEHAAGIASGLFETLGRATGFVVSKSPHPEPSPEEVARVFPDHPQVFLLRNPLHRLNSLHARDWLDACGPNHDLDRYKTFARWWLDAEHKVVYDDLREAPERFFRAIFAGWGLEATDADVHEAIRYARANYHDSSAKMSARRPDKPVSESRRRLPDEAIEAYLGDDFVRSLMEDRGWSVDPGAYRRKRLFR